MKLSTLSQHPDVESNIRLIEIWLKARMAYSGQPAVAVSIVHDQALVYANGFGTATADSIFRIASHSKLFTAISLMQLRDAGQVGLDDPVGQHLPWFSIQTQAEHVGGPEITIRHLMTHTAGLPREAGSGYWLDFEFPSQQEVRDRVGSLTKPYAASHRWKYSNLAWGLLGEVVQAVSGRPFNDYVQSQILDPLEMDSTSVDFPAEHEARLVTGYGRRLPDGGRETFPFIDAVGLASATGMSSTVNDMAKFMAWQFRLRDGFGSEILSANTLREMQRPHWVQKNWQSGWGLGFGITHQKNRDLIGHSGGYPGYLTNTRISPAEKIGVSVFTNSLDANPLEITDRIFEWMAPAIKKAGGDQKSDPAEKKAEWGKLEGTYRSPWADAHVMFLDGKLQIVNPTLPNPKSMALELVPAGENLFKLEGDNGGAAVGEPVTFEFDPETDDAISVKIGDNRTPRVWYD